MNELIVEKGIFRLLEIFLKLSPSFQSLTISDFCELLNSLPLAMIRTLSNDKQLKKVPVIGQMTNVFVNAPGVRDSIPGRIIPKTQKMVLDAALLNSQHYKVSIKGKVDHYSEWSSALHYT